MPFDNKQLAVLFAGGGTGGHLYPALALATRLRELHPDARVQFVGTARLEATKVPAAGFPLQLISVRGLAGPWSFAGLVRKSQSAALLALGIPLWQSVSILRHFQPDVVVTTGGYVCGPVALAAARFMKIPTISVEQNMRPGLTTRALSRLVDVACLISEASKENYPVPKRRFERTGKPRLVVTGNPIRREFVSADRRAGTAAFGLNPDKLTIFVTGGSLGSRLINHTFIDALENLADLLWFRNGVQIVHMTGANDQPALGERATRARLRYQAHQYLDNIPLAYAAADLVICRGGGTTIAELTACGVPAIIIPWAGAANNEQYYNSKPLAAAGGAILIREDEFTAGRLTSELKTLLQDPARLAQMAAASRSLGIPDAADRVLAIVEELAQLRSIDEKQ
jgi:UDP-N-acetylglucosamine--N-acetylmuramyl-(pentapeptide) pyrophosphoryl-undecaprenol N-acetylglucosamine transferase